MTQAPDSRQEICIRAYESGDEVRIVEAFNRIFSAVDPNFEPRSLAAWRWEFAENPSGFSAWVAETAEGRIVGHYAALVQPVLLEGRPATFLHGVDSMTDPAFRRSLSKGGLFARLGNTFLDHHGGEAPQRIPVIWGPPVPAAWRIGKAQIRYVLVRTQLKLVLEPGGLRPLSRSAQAVSVQRLGGFPDEVEALFERSARPFGAIVRRDRTRLDWRFLAHPEREYAVFGAFRARQLVGYAVTRACAFDGEECLTLLCDWIVPAEEEGAAEALLEALAEHARGTSASKPGNAATLCAVLPDTAPAWLTLQRAGFLVRPTRYLIAARVYDPRYRERWLHRHFYYTLGDMDLV